MALIATFRWPTRSGAASAAPSAALSGSQPKAPGSAGGYLLGFRHVIAVRLRSPLSIIPAEISFRLFRNVHHHRFCRQQLAVA